MKLHVHSILPFLIVISGGMGIGSLHNAMARSVIGPVVGYIFIGAALLELLTGLAMSRYYEGLPSIGYWGAVGLTAFVFAGGMFNIITTLSAPTPDPMLFHEYLGPVAGGLQLVKLLVEKFVIKTVKA